MFVLYVYWTDLKAQSFDENDSIDIVEWKENRRLTYNDFKGPQDSTFLVYGHPANGAASMNLIAQFAYDSTNTMTANVTNVFYKGKSWMVIRKPSVLNHEQGHFDISEIYARRLRKEIEILMDKGVEDEVTFRQLFNKYLQELKEFQDAYDSETHHGSIDTKQIHWDRKIEKELNNNNLRKQ